MRALRTAAAAVAALVAAGAVGCGGSSKDPLSGFSAQEILTRSRAAAAGLERYRVAGDARIQADLARGALPAVAVQALRPGIALKGEGALNGGSATVDFDVTLQGLPAIQANVTKVGGELFVGLLGTDYRVDVPRAQVERVIPAQLADGLLSWATDPREVGREEVDGTRTVHLRAAVDVDRAVADVGDALRQVSPGAVSPQTLRRAGDQAGAGLSERQVDLWIGVNDLLPRRVATRLRFSGRIDAFPGLRSAALDLDLRLSELGAAVDIQRPDATEVLDLGRLGSLAGG